MGDSCFESLTIAFPLSGSARVHLVTKPVRRCYLSSLAGVAKLFQISSSSQSWLVLTSLRQQPRQVTTLELGTHPVTDRPDEHSWAEGTQSGPQSRATPVQTQFVLPVVAIRPWLWLTLPFESWLVPQRTTSWTHWRTCA